MRQLFVILIFLFLSKNLIAQVGIGNTNPNAQLDVRSSNQATPAATDGILIPKVDTFPTGVNANQDAMLVYLTTTVGTNTPGFYYYNHATTTWLPIAGGKNTLDQAYDQGGPGNGSTIHATDGVVTISGEDGLYVKGTLGNGDAIALDASYDTHMFFNPRKGAFIAGFGNWTDANVGDYSAVFGALNVSSGQGSFTAGSSNQATSEYATATGSSNIASGIGSFATGFICEATASHSFASGYNTNAYGNNSFAANTATTASGYSSFAINRATLAQGDASFTQGWGSAAIGYTASALGNGVISNSSAEMAIGSFNTIYTAIDATGFNINDRVFSIGNGTSSARSDAFSVWKDGRVIINEAYTLPTSDGTANQVLLTDGSGQLSFSDASTTVIHSINDLTDGKSDSDGTNDGSSIFLGIDSGVNDDASNNRNVGIGFNSMYNNSTGAANTALGYNSLLSNTTGDLNLALGAYSLDANTTGVSNVAVGYSSLTNNVDGNYNIGIGRSSLVSNVSGEYNIGLGFESLRDNNGNSNIALGRWAMEQNTTGYENIAIGEASMRTSLTGNNNIAIGKSALFHNDEDENVAIGTSALYGNSTGVNNTAVGTYAGLANSTGRENTAIGYAALHDIDTGNFNTAVGSLSMRNADAATNNVAVGVETLRWTTGGGNVAIGNTALQDNVTGEDNTAVGTQALQGNTTGSYNTALGWLSLYQNSSGAENTALGQGAMRDNLDGNGNVSVGYWSLYVNTSGDNNVALGKFAGNGNLGSSNVFLGYSAGIAETGSNKLYIANSGVDANNALIYGEFDTNLLRFNARTEITNTTDANGTVGSGALEIGNSLRIDGNEIITNTGTVLFLQSDNNGDLEIDGGTFRVDASTNRIGVGTINPQTKLHIEGGSDASLAGGGFLTMGAVTATNMHMDNNEIMVRNNGISAPLYLQNEGGDVYVGGALVHSSDARLKKDIEVLPYGLNEILQLKPKQYNWKNRGEQDYKSLGLLAQEVQLIVPEIIHQADDEQQTLSVSYTELIPVLINATKEQQEIIENLKNENTELKSRLDKLEALMLNIKK